jgi:uncharacterized paraquat-inducible protein A
MADHTPVEAHPKDVERAQEMWHNVTFAGKWSIVGIVIIVALLGAVFIDWS